MVDANLVCKTSDTLLTAMELINKNAKGVVFVLDQDEKLCGIATDGDIRRALLNGFKLQGQIAQVMNTAYVYARDTDGEHDMLSKINYKVKIIPIVNESMRMVDYFEFKQGIRVPVAEPALNGNEFSYATDAILSTWISSNGKYIKLFEENFSQYCGCKYGAAVSNGTTALHLALLALNVGQGDEVIVPDLTFAATINTVLHAQATPVIVDVEEDSWCIDPKEIEKAITPRTKAIIPVHLYGQPCNMAEIMRIAKAHHLYVIEDCAEAHGAEYGRKKVGSFGDISCFSFFGNKVITTGEGGMCLTNSSELNDRMRVLRDHGMSKTKKYWHDMVGYNYRMTNIQAAIGVAQLEHIGELLYKRNELELQYNKALAPVKGIELQKRNLADRKKITWLVSILAPGEKRDQLLNLFNENGLEVRPFFYPLSQMDIYRKYGFGDLSVSRKISAKGINLPTTLNIKESAIEKIKELLIKNI